MKFLSFLFIAAAVFVSLVSGLHGQMQVPDDVIEISKLEKAKAKAAKEKKALAFILTDPGTN